MKKFLCWIGFHTWAPWSKPEGYMPAYKRQVRTCVICNIEKERVY